MHCKVFAGAIFYPTQQDQNLDSDLFHARLLFLPPSFPFTLRASQSNEMLFHQMSCYWHGYSDRYQERRYLAIRNVYVVICALFESQNSPINIFYGSQNPYMDILP